jgi:capsular polysaccharide biosynthesis protein
MPPSEVEYLDNKQIAGLAKGVLLEKLSIGGMNFYHCSGNFVHVFKKGLVCLNVDGVIVAARDSFNYALDDFTTNNIILYDDIEKPKTFDINGLCISLSTPWSFNFFHWIEELLKVCWIESQGVHPNYIIPNNSPIYAESLELLGVPKSRIVQVNGYNITFNECLLSPQVNVYASAIFKPLLKNLQNYIYSLSESSGSSAPCFLLRKQGGLTFSNRHLINEDEVIDFCDRQGFECFDPSDLSFAAQVDAFRNRKILAGVHGAGFCHQIWMKQNSCVVEVLSPQYINFSSLYVANALNNHYFMCTSVAIQGVNTPHKPEEVYAYMPLLENIIQTTRKLTLPTNSI